jgi:uncharacterized protein with FMN-binding domain
MKRIVLWLASTVTIVVLLFGYHTSTDDTSVATTPTSSATASSSQPSASASTGSSSSSSSSSSGTTSSSSSSSPSSSSSAAKTYTGSVASTRWGPVQVQITVSAGKITAVSVLQQPSGNPKDTEINDQALPVLIQDTLSAQSANIDMVSGATVTSDGYVQSLQAALDEAGL